MVHVYASNRACRESICSAFFLLESESPKHFLISSTKLSQVVKSSSLLSNHRSAVPARKKNDVCELRRGAPLILTAHPLVVSQPVVDVLIVFSRECTRLPIMCPASNLPRVNSILRGSTMLTVVASVRVNHVGISRW